MASSGPKKTRRLAVVRGDEIEPKLIRWFWQYKLADQELNVICGLPDQGKGALVADLVARATSGKPLPGETEAREPVEVLIFSGEETYAKTTLPRIMVAGGDPSRVHFVNGVQIEMDADEEVRGLAFTQDSGLIRQFLAEHPEVKLVVVDPVNAYFGGDKNSAQEVRKVYGALKRIAEDSRCCFVLVDHFNKNNKQTAIHRVSGSQDAVATPRTAWVVSKDGENPIVRHFANLKGNEIPEEFKTGWEFRIVSKPLIIEGEEASLPSVEWLGVSALSGAQLISQKSDPEAPQLEIAKKFYVDVLKAGKPRLQTELYEELEKLKISDRTAKRARSELGFTAKNGHLQQIDGRWWFVPPPDADDRWDQYAAEYSECR